MEKFYELYNGKEDVKKIDLSVIRDLCGKMGKGEGGVTDLLKKLPTFVLRFFRELCLVVGMMDVKDFKVVDYSELSYVIHGEGTRILQPYIQVVLNGKWNPGLKEHGVSKGYVVGKKGKEEKVLNLEKNRSPFSEKSRDLALSFLPRIELVLGIGEEFQEKAPLVKAVTELALFMGKKAVIKPRGGSLITENKNTSRVLTEEKGVRPVLRPTVKQVENETRPLARKEQEEVPARKGSHTSHVFLPQGYKPSPRDSFVPQRVNVTVPTRETKEKEAYKPYQKKVTPEVGSALYSYYTSLYRQNPESALAIVWLVEHGVFDGDKREDILWKYKDRKLQGTVSY